MAGISPAFQLLDSLGTQSPAATGTLHPSSPSLPFPGAWAVFLRGTKGQPAVPGHTEEAVVSGAVVLRPSSRCLQAWALQPPHPASTPRLLPPALFHCCSSWRDGREGSSAHEADSFKPF